MINVDYKGDMAQTSDGIERINYILETTRKAKEKVLTPEDEKNLFNLIHSIPNAKEDELIERMQQASTFFAIKFKKFSIKDELNYEIKANLIPFVINLLVYNENLIFLNSALGLLSNILVFDQAIVEVFDPDIVIPKLFEFITNDELFYSSLNLINNMIPFISGKAPDLFVSEFNLIDFLYEYEDNETYEISELIFKFVYTILQNFDANYFNEEVITAILSFCCSVPDSIREGFENNSTKQLNDILDSNIHSNIIAILIALINNKFPSCVIQMIINSNIVQYLMEMFESVCYNENRIRFFYVTRNMVTFYTILFTRSVEKEFYLLAEPLFALLTFNDVKDFILNETDSSIGLDLANSYFNLNQSITEEITNIYFFMGEVMDKSIYKSAIKCFKFMCLYMECINPLTNQYESEFFQKIIEAYLKAFDIMLQYDEYDLISRSLRMIIFLCECNDNLSVNFVDLFSQKKSILEHLHNKIEDNPDASWIGEFNVLVKFLPLEEDENI